MMTCIFAFFSIFLIVAQATLTFGEMRAIIEKGTIRHLGVPYAHFVSGRGDGFSTELIKGFANDLGVRYEYVETTWQSVLTDLTGKTYQVDDGKVDVTGESPIKGDVIATGLTILPWRKALLDFSRPTFPTGIWLVARSDSPLQPIRPGRTIAHDIKTVKSLLNGVSVLYMPGKCLDPALYQLENTGATFIPLNLKMNEFVPAVINRDADCTLLDVADSMIALEKWPGKLKIIGPVTDHQKMGCGFRKSDADLCARFNHLNWAIVELAAYTRQMSFRYSRLCGKASNDGDAVRSATPPGGQILGGNNGLSYYRACPFS